MGANQLHYRTSVTSICQTKKYSTTPTRFELARAEPIGFQNQLLNHSDTVSSAYSIQLHNEQHPQGQIEKKLIRQRRDLNSRGHSPVDFESTSLTTRTRCLQQSEAGVQLYYNKSLPSHQGLLVGDWSSGMIPALGAGGREFDSRITPVSFFGGGCICTGLGQTQDWGAKKNNKKGQPDAGLEPATSRLRACHSTD